MRGFFYVLLATAAAEVLEDGEPVERQTDAPHTFSFEFHSPLSEPEKLLRVETISYSDVRNASVRFGPAGELGPQCVLPCLIVKSVDDFKPDTLYQVDVTCDGPCHFSLVVSYAKSVHLTDGLPLRGTADKGGRRDYVFTTGSDPPPEAMITVLPEDSRAVYEVSVTESDSGDQHPVEASWHRGYRSRISPLRPNTAYEVRIQSESGVTYAVTAVTESSVQTLQASVPTQGSVAQGQFAYYRVLVADPNETLVIQLTTFSGTADIFVKFGIKPAEHGSDFELRRSSNGTLTIDKHQRATLGHSTGEYFIGVFGTAPAVYTLMISVNDDSWVPLFDGLPQNGYADYLEVDYYYLDVPYAQDLNLTFRVNTANGDPDLYVRLCLSANLTSCAFSDEELTEPSGFPGLYSSHRSIGDEFVAVQHASSQCVPEFCRYVAGVVGRARARSRFSILATLDKTSEHVLMSGRSMQMTIDAPGYLYFKFTVFNATVTNVTVQLTPVFGDSDLYVTRSGVPSPDNFEKESTLQQALVDKVDYARGEDGETLKGTYHIAVKSASPASFSIVAVETTPERNVSIHLTPGRSQQDTVYFSEHNNYRLYTFTVHYTETDKEPLSVTLAPLSGRYYLYVSSVDNNIDWERGFFYYDWCYCYGPPFDQTTILTIETWHPSYRANSDYVILVKAVEFARDGSASYRITYSTGSSTVILQENIPFQDQVGLDVYRTYAFPILYAHEDVKIAVVPITGDPDVYLSFRDSNPSPSKENYDFYTHSHGAEVFSVQWEQGIGNACPKNEKGELLQCTLYISVYGYTASVYTIAVSVRLSQPSLLAEGIPAYGELAQADWAYYFTLVQSNLPFTAKLQSRRGNANLYVNVLDYATSGSDTAALQRPDKEFNQYYSESTWLLESVELQPTHLASNCASGTCIALMGVYCETVKCSFTLTATQHAFPMLAEDEPKIASVVALQYTYFVFQSVSNVTEISITVTALNSGDPDLYVRRGRVQEFQRREAEWSSITAGSESLVISASDPQFADGQSMSGFYIIGVWSRSNTTFSITVSTHKLPLVTLYSRVPVQGQVIINRPLYYRYIHLDENGFVIRITPLSCEAEIKVSQYSEAMGDIYEHLPSNTRFEWSSAVSGTRNSITISNLTSQTYLIGVFTEFPSCDFSLSVSTSYDAGLLFNGIPAQGYLSQGRWAYYNFFAGNDSDTEISLITLEGQATLYVSNTEEVSDSVSRWSLTSPSLNKHLHIAKADLSQGLLLIGVFAVLKSKFAITAHSSDNVVTLIDGWPQSYSMLYDNRDHLSFQYVVRSYLLSSVCCKLHSLSPGFWPSVQVSFSNNSNIHSSTDSIEARYDESQYEHIFQALTFTLPFVGFGAYQLTVFGRSSDTYGPNDLGTFELTCSGQTDYKVLRTGTVWTGRVDKEKRRDRFEVFVPEPSLLEAVVVLCSGKAELSVSSNYTLYSQSTPDISVTRPVDGRIVAVVLRAVGEYYLTVEGQEVEYQLTAVLTANNAQRPKAVVPGNDGLLEWAVKNKRTVEMSWAPAVLEDGSSVQSPVKYHVFASEQPEALTSVCVISKAVEAGIVWPVLTDVEDTTNCSFTVKQDRKLVVNVVATALDSGNPLLSAVPYSPTEVLIRKRERKASSAWLALLLAALVLALSGLALYHFKYRRTRQRLFHELTVVREAVRSPDDTVDIELPQQHTPKPFIAVSPVCLAVLAASQATCPKDEPAFHEFDEARMSRQELGDHGWALLHTMAAYFPDLPSESQLADAYQYLILFARMYPCRRCSQHFQTLLSEKPPLFKTRNEFVIYLCELHNVINELVGKPLFPCELERLTDKWGGGADCGCA